MNLGGGWFGGLDLSVGDRSALTLKVNLGGQFGGADLLGGKSVLTLEVKLGAIGSRLALTLEVNLGGHSGGPRSVGGKISCGADWHSLWK